VAVALRNTLALRLHQIVVNGAFSRQNALANNRDRSLEEKMATLTVQSGPLSGSVMTIPKGRFLIGRALDCQLRLVERRASRHHCVLTFDGHELRIRDLGSRYGTVVNDRQIGLWETRLKHDDSFSIVATVIKVDLATA
jgi:pSer/pThr/pTyr-binding forkhead associated (FHA) protein